MLFWLIGVLLFVLLLVRPSSNANTNYGGGDNDYGGYNCHDWHDNFCNFDDFDSCSFDDTFDDCN
ncbi:MAG: hypothetical protein PHE67_01185 [Campylobacterales bacterium]|nr:hypothetical protein [Campylobacterales bacterium]